MASDKLLECKKCGFNNRPQDVKCLFCASPLVPAEQASADSTPAKQAKTPKTSSRPIHSPDDDLVTQTVATRPTEFSPLISEADINEPVEEVLNNRSTRRFTKPTVSDLVGSDSAVLNTVDIEETKNSPEALAQQMQNNGEVEPSAPARRPKRGQTTRFEPAEGTLLFWIYCDPLEPIPVGYSREITAGRHQKNDLVLPHNEVSRFHASFKVRGQSVTLEDLGSSNGVLINGVRKTRHRVSVGDRVQIGPYQLLIKEPNDYQPRDTSEDDDDLNKTRTAPAFAAFSEENVALSGNIQDTPLQELIQGFEFNQKTGTLVVIHRNMFGWFGVKSGQPHTAGFQDKTGSTALYEMLSFKDGRFTFYNTEPEGDREISLTITGILLNYGRLNDERAQEANDFFNMLPE